MPILMVFQLADAPVAHGLARLAKTAPRPLRTLLRAGLQNNFLCLHRPPQADGLGDAVCDRLLHINVLARNGRLNGDQRVRMIRHAHHDRVNFRRREHFTIIVEDFHVHTGFALAA